MSADRDAGQVRLADEGWWSDKSIAEIVHEYAVVRGDLVEQYARDQLVEIIERRILAARQSDPDATERVEWQTCPNGGRLPAIRGHRSREDAERHLAPGRHLVQRTVTTYAPVVGEWTEVGE